MLNPGLMIIITINLKSHSWIQNELYFVALCEISRQRRVRSGTQPSAVRVEMRYYVALEYTFGKP